MSVNWRKQTIDEYIRNLKDYYKDCSKEYFRTSNSVENLNLEERLYLNNNFCLLMIYI
jgi:hypothetical protein